MTFSEIMERLKPGAVFAEYTLDSCLGKGAFGSVWSTRKKASGDSYAIKFELPTIHKPILKDEAKINAACSGLKYFPQYFGFSTTQGFSFMISEKLGISVRNFQETYSGGIVPLSIVGKLGVCMLHALEAFHERGFIHRDVKPSNFVFRGDPKNFEICMIDFGLAKAWKDEKNNPIPERPNVGFRGTARYASVNSHHGADLGRRDDIWSLFYIILELSNPPLPWKSLQDKNAVKQVKMRGVNQLMPGANELFGDFASNIRNLAFLDKPDYEGLDNILTRMIDIGDDGYDGGDYGFAYPNQYDSLQGLQPMTGSVIGSDSSVEGSWENDDNNAFGPESDVPVVDSSKTCCSLI